MKYPLSLILLLFINCNINIVDYNKNGEPILGKNMHYNFNEKPSTNDLKKIDTTAYYVQMLEEGYHIDGEPVISVLQFHNDGYFKASTKKYFENFPNRSKETIWYGGKYKISDSNIELESFYTSSGSKTKIYNRKYRKGIIEGDKIILEEKNKSPLNSVYQKKDTLK